MRIASLLPSATEIAYALGLGDQLVGVTHECDFPPEARSKPVLTRSRIGQGLSSAEIEHAVSTRLGGHQSLYALDEKLLAELRPDLVLTQELCDVCAVSYEEVKAAAARLMDVGTRVVSLEPMTLEDVLCNIELLGDLTGRRHEAEALVAGLRERLDAVRRRLGPEARRPRVWVCEWLDPPYSAGHWVSAQVEMAGGREVFERKGIPSTRVAPEAVVAAAPDVIVLAPCGFHVDDVLEEMSRIVPFPGWRDLPGVRAGQVWAVDASAYFSRPGPRIVGGVELLARLLHPEIFGAPDPAAARRVARAFGVDAEADA